MTAPRYQVVPQPIGTILTWVKSKEIAIPEIQRPFVWDASKVRDLLDSLYQGFPIGYLIAWSNPTVRLKDGGHAAGKRILIDGQQRVTALMASLLGITIINKDYVTTRITIAFNPLEEKFEVLNPVIAKSKEWIPDVSAVFSADVHMLNLVDDYCAKNEGVDKNKVFDVLNNLVKIQNNVVGVIELSNELDIETVTEIFIRVNSQGAQLSQADFAMSKIAANETYEGNLLRKAIDYFCHLAVAPEFITTIQERDKDFAKSEFFPKMKWIAEVNEDIYDPSYTDMLRVAFVSEFGRGKLQDLVALLSGRNFETREFEEAIAEASFKTLKDGILNFMNKTQFQRFVMIVKSAGFVSNSLLGSQTVLDFAYIVYLHGRAKKMDPAELETIVRQWLVMAMITGRYSGQAESIMDQDIRQINQLGLVKYTKLIMDSALTDSFWDSLLPQEMDTSSVNSPYLSIFFAAQVKNGDRGFLSRDITVSTMIQNQGDIHHIYPRKFLKSQGLSRTKYNQIANYAMTQSEINIAIGAKDPDKYFAEIIKQIETGKLKYGGIKNEAELKKNFEENCIPVAMLELGVMDYDEFLNERRVLMSMKMKRYFHSLGEIDLERE
jgi:hypothetical protein